MDDIEGDDSSVLEKYSRGFITRGLKWKELNRRPHDAISPSEPAICYDMYFHLLRGRPVFPSKVRFKIYELRAQLSDALDLANMAVLASFGLDTARFLDAQGILVPSARRNCSNLVIFCDRTMPGDIEVVKDHGFIDWISVKSAL